MSNDKELIENRGKSKKSYWCRKNKSLQERIDFLEGEEYGKPLYEDGIKEGKRHALSSSNKQIEKLKRDNWNLKEEIIICGSEDRKRGNSWSATEYKFEQEIREIKSQLHQRETTVSQVAKRCNKQREEIYDLINDIINWYDNEGRSRGEWEERINLLQQEHLNQNKALKKQQTNDD